jgi:membrane complex biogenesis BtpA family protein
MKAFDAVFSTAKPIIGMVHLPPLPGSPLFDAKGGMKLIIERALEDTKALVEGGIDGVQVENQFDRPFLKPGDIGFETVAAITATICSIRAEFRIPVGVCVHLNGVGQAIAVAVAGGCQWVRAFELANAYVSNAGVLEAAGPEAMRYRAFLRAEGEVMVFGDFHVKHGSHAITADRSLEDLAEDVQMSMADAAIITGSRTGAPPTPQDVERIKKVIHLPVLIGSGISEANLDQLLPRADGAIVGTAFKSEGRLENRVDAGRVRRFMEKARKLR